MKSSITTKKYSKDGKLLTGFTIIELIISIFILSVAIVGIYGAFSMIVVLTADASDRLTAAYLAQEGIEIARNIRDTNWLASDSGTTTDWLQSLSACTSDIGGCEADYTTGSGATVPFAMATYQNDYLKIDTNGFYNYSSGQKTKFRRQILVSFLPGIDYVAKIAVTVYWDEKPNVLNPTGAPGSITAEEYFYNWYNYNS